MFTKIVIAGSAAAVVLGAGTAALAASGATSPSPAASSTTSNATADPTVAKADRDRLRRALHAQWVTRNGKTNTFVTHDAIRGAVTAVSPSSITVKALDGVSQTYAVSSDTKVHLRADGKGKAGTIGEVHVDDRVIVVGTGTTSLSATHVADLRK